MLRYDLLSTNLKSVYLGGGGGVVVVEVRSGQVRATVPTHCPVECATDQVEYVSAGPSPSHAHIHTLRGTRKVSFKTLLLLLRRLHRTSKCVVNPQRKE